MIRVNGKGKADLRNLPTAGMHFFS